MVKSSVELVRARRKEIINACEYLYKTMSFKEITIKEIGKITSFTRTSIYNYFETKEEIFLALLQKEYQLWNMSLQRIMTENETLSRIQFADAIAHSLEERDNLLKIKSMNHYDMEENSRLERLAEFKEVYGKSLSIVRACLDKFFDDMSTSDKEDFIYSFFPFMFGIYPYTFVTKKQIEAMSIANVSYVNMSIYKLVFAEVKKILAI